MSDTEYDRSGNLHFSLQVEVDILNSVLLLVIRFDIGPYS